MDREKLVDETLMLLPTLMRLVERPSPVEMGEIARRGLPTDAQVSPGHIQVLIALTRGPRSVGKLAEELEVSPPAATQLAPRATRTLTAGSRRSRGPWAVAPLRGRRGRSRARACWCR